MRMLPSLVPQTVASSFNFSVFKVLAILMVVTSHWFVRLPLWIPTTVGLFIFSFSSALFTTRSYGVEVDVGAFWRKKLQRLLVRFWFLQLCLAALLLARGETVLHWHSLVHMMGLSLFLNLSGHSESALGLALWFLTLLLLFYAAYPWLVRLCAACGDDFYLPLLAAIVLTWLDRSVHVGFALWLTALGFVLGVFAGLYGTRVRPALALASAIGALLLILAANAVFGYRALNDSALAVACIGTSLWLLAGRLPQWPLLRALARMEAILLEVFIIHAYLFVHPSGNSVLDFLLSLALILAAAWGLNLIGSRLVARMFAGVG